MKIESSVDYSGSLEYQRKRIVLKFTEKKSRLFSKERESDLPKASLNRRRRVFSPILKNDTFEFKILYPTKLA